VVPGAPVSVLLEQGLAETVVDKLVENGVSMVEKLGAMTPEQLEEIPGVDADMIEQIQQAVVGYYGQFEITPPHNEPDGSAHQHALNGNPEKESAVEEVPGAVVKEGVPTEFEPKGSPEQSVTIENKELPPEGL